MKHCSSCGNALSANAKFCGKCGKAVPTPSTQTPIKEAPPVQAPIKTATNVPVSAPPKNHFFRNLFVLLILVGTGWGVWKYVDFAALQSGSNYTDIVLPEYTPKDVVSGEAITESQEAIAANGEAVIKMQGGAGIQIKGLPDGARVKVQRSTNTLQPGAKGLQTTGAMLDLTIITEGDFSSIDPEIIFPASDIGAINPATINIFREADATLEIPSKQSATLPAFKNKEGNFYTHDYLITTAFQPYSPSTTASWFEKISRSIFSSAYAQKPADRTEYIAHVKYTVITFQGHVDWNKNPQLIQMLPDNSVERRMPMPAELKSSIKKPVVNIVVLVHGHNEFEKGGEIKNDVNEPWQYDYKQRVWSTFYRNYQAKMNSSVPKNDKGDPQDCTIFYEFIYPTYRPIFSPVPLNASSRHKTLGEDFADLIRAEFTQKNATIAYMLKEKIPFNFYIVGHSMGGLVARAGLNALEQDKAIMDNFKHLITWGTPHMGSPLVTLRYILADGMRVSFNGIPVSLDFLNAFVSDDNVNEQLNKKLQLNTPGTFDLRWTYGKHQLSNSFNFHLLVSSTFRTAEEDIKYLQTNPLFYNDNLKAMNDNAPGYYANKFTTLFAITPDVASLQLNTGWKSYFIKNYEFVSNTTELQKGAGIIQAFGSKPDLQESDGAVPQISQIGFELKTRPNLLFFGAYTHEDFFSSQLPGDSCANMTFRIMNYYAKCDCPQVKDFVLSGDTIKGRLDLPLDPVPGKRIKKIRTVVLKQDAGGEELDLNYEIAADGKFFAISSEPFQKDNNTTLKLYLTFNDETEIETNDLGVNFFGEYEGTHEFQLNTTAYADPEVLQRVTEELNLLKSSGKFKVSFKIYPPDYSKYAYYKEKYTYPGCNYIVTPINGAWVQMTHSPSVMLSGLLSIVTPTITQVNENGDTYESTPSGFQSTINRSFTYSDNNGIEGTDRFYKIVKANIVGRSVNGTIEYYENGKVAWTAPFWATKVKELE